MANQSSRKKSKVPHQYQIAAMEMALEKNVILCLPTGSGKTFIAIMVINKYAEYLNRPFNQGGKRAFFLVPTKVLVTQQAAAIKADTAFSVGRFSGESKDGFGVQIDTWTPSYWANRLEKYQVLVMTRKIFLDILSSGYVKTSQIATIIFDEAHRGAPNAKGKLTNDEYVVIMDILRRNREHSGIRIVGLTASLINNRWVCDQKMDQMISTIESIFNSSVFFPDCTRGGKTKEIIWCYKETEGWDIECQSIPAALKKLADRIPTKKGSYNDENADEQIPVAISLENGAVPVTPKQLKNTFNELARICVTFGPWSLLQSLGFVLKSFEVVCQQTSHLKSSFIEIIDLVIKALQDIQLTVEKKLLTYKESDALLAGVTDKMLRTLVLLHAFNDRPSHEPLSAIIFVERRLDAFALAQWLNAVAAAIPEYSFIKAAFTVGSATYAPFPFNAILKSHQASIIEDFKNRKLNIIVSTSVLEEGLDITHCNLIVRYDESKTFRSYVQSKGRARKLNAYIVHLTGEKSRVEMEIQLRNFHHTELRLPAYKKPDSPSNTMISSTEYLQTSVATLPHIEAKNRVIFYCDHLPSDCYTSKIPKSNMDEIKLPSGETVYCCELILPKVSALHKYKIVGKKCFTEQQAENEAYLEAIRMLWATEELDDSFRPLDKETLLNKLLLKYDLKTDRTEIREWKKEVAAIEAACQEEYEKSGKRKEPELPPKPGTHKKRRQYPLVWSKALQGYQSLDSPCWLHKITLTHVSDLEKIPFNTLGLISFHPLPLHEIKDKISIYTARQQVALSFELIQSFVPKRTELEEIIKFQDFIYSGCLKIGQANERAKSKVFFSDSASSYHLLFTLLTPENTIDYSVLNETYKKRPIVADDLPKLAGALITKRYGPNTRGLFKVETVDYSLSPRSQFPADKSMFSTYADYYRETYNVTFNEDQPLLACYSLPTKHYSPTQPSSYVIKKMANQKLVHLIPEICSYEYSLSIFVEIFYTIPAITTALNQYLIASEIRKRLCSEIGYGLAEIPSHDQPTWRRERFTNFVPLDVEVAPIGQSSQPADLSYVSCTLSVKMDEQKLRTASMVSLDVAPDQGEDEVPYETDDSSIEYDSLEFQDDLDDQYSKPFNPEIAEMEAVCASTGDTKLDLKVFTADKVTIFGDKRPPAVRSVPWNDRDFQVNSVFSRLERELTSQKFNLKQDDMDIEIEEMVAEPDMLNNFAHENSVIISTNSIYADRSKVFKYGLPTELIIEALSTKKSDSFVNLERLEIIGDSFLKYIISTFLFLQLSDLNETRLTGLKMHLISNFHLLQLGRAKGLAQNIFDKLFRPQLNWMPPFSSSNDPEFTEQDISDKSVADMVEAMIGAHLTCLGEDAAIRFLIWLGMPLDKLKDQEVEGAKPSCNRWLPMYRESDEDPDEIARIWASSNLSKLEAKLQYVFKRKELLIEALTHPSWSNARLNSYQRLEFIGDAILDYLITSYIFDHPNYKKLTPGAVTNIRQSLVNNDYFATISMVNDFSKFIFYASSTLYSAIVDFRQQLTATDLMSGNQIKLGSFLLEDQENLNNSILADAPKALGDIFESIAGAIYLDSGNSLATVWQVYSRFLGNELEFFCMTVPKSPVQRLFESFPGSKIVSVEMSDAKQTRKKLNLIVNSSDTNEVWTFSVDEDELVKTEMNKRKEKLSLVLKALATLKDRNPLIANRSSTN